MKKKSLPKKAKNGKSIGSYDSKDTGYYQNGGRTPIYTSDKNDPRLKAYLDSLSTFKNTRKIASDFKNLSSNFFKTKEDYIKYRDNELRKYPFNSSIRNNTTNNINDLLDVTFDIPSYGKQRVLLASTPYPVQPIIYRPGEKGMLMDAYLNPRPKEQSINIQSFKPDLLQGNDINMFNPIPFEKGTYFTRPRQSQEVGQGKTDYFDKQTGKLLGTYENGGQIPMAKDGKWIQKAINPKHKGYCTPMTKSTCTPRRKALAKTLKKMAKRRKGENGVEMPEQDAQMEQIMAMAMQAIQQGASPQEVMQMLVQQGVPQEIAQQIVMQVTQQGQMQEPQEVPQADLGVQVESFGALPLATPSIAGDFTKVPMTDVDQFAQKRDKRINRNQGVRDFFAGALNPYYNAFNIARNVHDLQETSRLLESPDASGYSDVELKALKRDRNLSKTLIGGYSLAAGRDSALTGLGLLATGISDRRTRLAELQSTQLAERDLPEMLPYRTGYSLREGVLPYAEMGTKVPCAECGKHMAYGGKLGFIAAYGTQLPTHGLDFLSYHPNVNAEGDGSRGKGEVIVDNATKTVTNLDGAPTHEQQDNGAPAVNIRLSGGSAVIPTDTKTKDTPDNFLKRFADYPEITTVVMDLKKKRGNKRISWAEIADKFNTKPEVKALELLEKDVARQSKKPMKLINDLEPYIGNKQDTNIASTTDKLNIKLAKYKLQRIQQEAEIQKQQIQDVMEAKASLVKDVIYPGLEQAIIHENAYGGKVKQDFMKNNEAKYGKKLPKAQPGIKVDKLSSETQPASGMSGPFDPNSLPKGYGTPQHFRRLMENYATTTGYAFPHIPVGDPDEATKLASVYQKALLENNPRLISNLMKTGAIPLSEVHRSYYAKKHPNSPASNENIIDYFTKNPSEAVSLFYDKLPGIRGFLAEDKPFSTEDEYKAFLERAQDVGGGYYYDPTNPGETGYPFIYRPSYSKPASSQAETTKSQTSPDASVETFHLDRMPGAKRLPFYTEPLHPAQIVGEVADVLAPKKQVPLIEDLGPKQSLSANTRKRFTEIQPQLNRLRRATLAQTRGVGIDPVSQAQRAQAYANEYDAANPVYGNKATLDAAIEQEYINREIELRRQAGLARAQGLDTHAQRTATRDWKAYALRRNALASISNKYLQNRLENRTSALTQDLFDNYRIDPTTWGTVFTGSGIPLQAYYTEKAKGIDWSEGGKYKVTQDIDPSTGAPTKITRELIQKDKSSGKYGTKVKLPSKSLKKVK